MTPQQQAPGIPHATYTTGQWAKGVVEWLHEDTAYLSVVFSWHADAAYERAVWYKSQGYTVRVGGPAVHVMGKHLQDVAETGGHVPDAVARHRKSVSGGPVLQDGEERKVSASALTNFRPYSSTTEIPIMHT